MNGKILNATFLRTAITLASLTCSATVNAAVHYVDVNSANPTPPYTNWATAATVIQSAIDISLPGDEIVVTNGVYETGGRAVYPGMTNRVAVTKPLTLRSINGPEVTIIRGYQVPGTTNGSSAVRCAYLTNGAMLAGFTLKNGATHEYDLPLPELVRGAGAWCESTSAILSNCVLRGNSAPLVSAVRYCNDGSGGEGNSDEKFSDCPGYIGGGGVYRGTLCNCELWNNSSQFGGGAYLSTLNSCLLIGNSALYGGGAWGGTPIIPITSSAPYVAGADRPLLQLVLVSMEGHSGKSWRTANSTFCILITDTSLHDPVYCYSQP